MDTSENVVDSTSTWLHADPALLRMSAHGMSLSFMAGDLATRTNVLAQTTALVQEHLAAAGWRWTVLQTTETRAFLSRPTTLDAQTTSLSHAAQMELHDALPQGNDAATLRRTMTELQMLLHEKLNESGAANTLWLWGLGRIAPSLNVGLPKVWSNTPYVHGVYRSQGMRVNLQMLPSSLAAVLDTDANHRVVVLDTYADEELNEAWFEPALQALRQGRIHRLDLCIDGWSVSAMRSWWRRSLWRRSWWRPWANSSLSLPEYFH
jgi:hypothetical protein